MKFTKVIALLAMLMISMVFSFNGEDVLEK